MLLSVWAASSERAPGSLVQYTRIRADWSALRAASAAGEAGSARISNKPRGMLIARGTWLSLYSPGSRTSTISASSDRLSAPAASAGEISTTWDRAAAISPIKVVLTAPPLDDWVATLTMIGASAHS